MKNKIVAALKTIATLTLCGFLIGAVMWGTVLGAVVGLGAGFTVGVLDTLVDIDIFDF